jgi:hypothetical protein
MLMGLLGYENVDEMNIYIWVLGVRLIMYEFLA